MRIEQPGIFNISTLPACIDADQAAKVFGWPTYFIPLLMRTGHLKPLGKPSQNSRKWFATAELERLSRDVAWLDKAVRIVEKHVHENGKKRRNRSFPAALNNPSKESAPTSATLTHLPLAAAG